MEQFIANYSSNVLTETSFEVVNSSKASYSVISPHGVPIILQTDQIDLGKAPVTSAEELELVGLLLAAYARPIIGIARNPRQHLVGLSNVFDAMTARIEAHIVLLIEEQDEASTSARRKAIIDSEIDRLSRNTADGIESARRSYADASDNLQKDLASLREQVTKSSEAAALAHDRAAYFETRISEVTSSISDKERIFHDQFAESENKAKAFMNAVRAEANFADLKLHWTSRANRAWWALVLSSISLGVLLLVVPIVGITCSDSVISFVHHIMEIAAPPSAAVADSQLSLVVSTVSRLVVITIPVALYFWVIRLIVRFNMRSMLLMDDATQRATILETYYRMVEKDVAKVDDRALILQALVRPPPGHGPDSVEPPNFTEVIEKAMGRPT